MPRNNIVDLQNHLFSQLERLNSESLSDEQLKFEIERSKAVASIAKEINANTKNALLVCESVYNQDELPAMLGVGSE